MEAEAKMEQDLNGNNSWSSRAKGSKMPGKGVQEEAFLLVPEGSRKADRSGRRQPSKHQPQPDQ